MLFRRVVWFAYLLLWSLALTTPQPARISSAVLPDPAQFPSAKALHVLGYTFLCVLTGWQRWLSPRWRCLLLLGLSAHACATEIIQLFVPERHGAWQDVALNHVGLYLGIALAWRWWRE